MSSSKLKLIHECLNSKNMPLATVTHLLLAIVEAFSDVFFSHYI